MASWQPPQLPDSLTSTTAPTFVGRASETDVAEQCWVAARSGSRQLLFVGGEPGAGKSRFTAEVAAATHRQGAVVLAGSCSPESPAPFEPFAQCLEQLFAGTAPGALAAVLPDSAGELARLSPSVLRHRPDLVVPHDGRQRHELFDAVVDVLRAVGQVRPVVCVLDDLHWAGGPSLQLLGHLARHAGQAHLLILGTHRTTAPDRSEPLTYAVADLYRLDGVRRLDLAGLSADEIAEYLVLEGRLGVVRARELAALLRDQTGGNPFFLREAWSELASRHRAGHATAGAPASIRDTLQRRLSHLDQAQRTTLETAAVLGDGADLQTLVSACRADPDATLAAADVAAGYGLLDPAGLERGRIVFPHMLARQAVLDLLAPSQRARLHATVGEVLERSHTETPAMDRALAHHFTQARALGLGDRAAHYLVRSAQDAERSLAFEDAAGWFEQAADLLADEPRRHQELRFAAARCHVRGGDFARARALYGDLAATTSGRARLHAAIGFEDAGWRPGLPGRDAYALLSQALAGVPADPRDADYVWARASLGRALVFVGEAARAREVATAALTQARELGDPRVIVHALAAMMWQALPPERLVEQRQLAAELGRRALATSDWDQVGTSAAFLAPIAYLQADCAAWDDAIAEMDLAAHRSGQPFMGYVRQCSDYGQAFLHGRFAAAEQVAEELLERGRSFGPDDTEGPYGLQMFMIRRETGALAAVRPLLETGAAPAPSWEPGLLALYCELGLPDRARPLLARLLASLDDSRGRHSPWSQWTAVLVFLIEAALELADPVAARRLRPLLEPYRGQQLVSGMFVALFGPADAYLGALDTLLGDTESADLLFTSALDQAVALGSIVHRAQTLAMWSRSMARRAGVPSRARAEELAGQARSLARAIGQQRVLNLLGPIPDTTPGLTPREGEVLQLVAEGLSNRQISRRLQISENTTANHVRSILTKTDTTNRTQLTRLALSRGWVSDAHGAG